MKYKYSINEDSIEIKLIGDLDTPAATELLPEMSKLTAHTSKEIIVDCSELSYIASSGLRLFITIHKQCNSEGGHMKLVNVSSDVMEIFSVTAFDKVFDIN